jgi:hypothetical protein
MAGAVVAIMLAGLPLQVGLYASILPLLILSPSAIS